MQFTPLVYPARSAARWEMAPDPAPENDISPRVSRNALGSKRAVAVFSRGVAAGFRGTVRQGIKLGRPSQPPATHPSRNPPSAPSAHTPRAWPRRGAATPGSSFRDNRWSGYRRCLAIGYKRGCRRSLWGWRLPDQDARGKCRRRASERDGSSARRGGCTIRIGGRILRPTSRWPRSWREWVSGP